MRDTDDQEWAKLIESSHIDQATRYIRRLSLALHLSFMVTFTSSLSSDEHMHLLECLAAGSIEDNNNHQL
jgi:hypothetical protein